MIRIICGAALAALCVLPAAAQDADQLGDLNPDEMTWQRVMRDIERGQTTMTNCAAGYYITKSGRHGPARTLFERCADGHCCRMAA